MEEGGGEKENLIEFDSSVCSTEADNSNKDEDVLDIHVSEPAHAEDTTQNETSASKLENSKRANPEEKVAASLSGWLLPKNKGLVTLKLPKQRWYQFGEENCKLYCYRDPQDLVPLSEINIATASFDFDAANCERPGLFQIRSDGKEYGLDAGNRQNMFHWLQALQMKRRCFNLSRVTVSTDRLGQWSLKRTSNNINVGGLISKEGGSTAAPYEPVTEMTSDLPEITVPQSDAHSSNSSLNSIPAAPSTNKSSLWPLNNLKSELTQKWSGLKFPGRLGRDGIQQRELSDSVFYCDLNNPETGDSTAEILSVSTISINSDDSLPNSETGNSRESEPVRIEQDDETGCDVTVEKDATLTHSSTSDGIMSKKPSRSGSWSFVSKKTQVSKSETQAEAAVQSDKNDKNKEANKRLTQGEGQGHVSSQGQLKDTGQGQHIPEEPNKQGKFMSTFANLKKMKLGRRQVSEPAPSTTTRSSNADSQHSDVGRGKERLDPPVRDMCDLEEELKANRDVVSVLQLKLVELTKELQSREIAGDSTEDEKTRLLIERDKLILGLQTDLDNSKQKYISMEETLSTRELEVQASKDQVAMYSDMLKAKDEVITSLTDQLYKSEEKKNGTRSRSNSFGQPDVVQTMSSARDSTTSLNPERLERDVERYKDMCQGYELQHKFLTKEILELNDLRKDDLAREKKLMMDFAKMQAKYYQIKSKYYVLLKQKKEQNPVRDIDGEGGQEVVDQLLQDAMEADTDDLELRLTGSAEEYDRYGFSRKHYLTETEELEVDPLANKAAELERQSEQLNSKVKDADREASLRVKWENYIVGRGGKLQKCQELKSLIRQGIPHEYREDVWKACIHFCVGEIREKLGPNYFQSLLEKKAVSQGSDPAIKQIELDLLRTLPNNKHYESIDSEGIVKLRRILLAFNEYNHVIGYCQGLNRLAAIALLFLNEEDAFWCLVAIVDHILPAEYFSKTLMAAQADQRVLKDLIKEKLPYVHQKLESNQVDLSLFTFNWFLTIFVDNIPTEMFLRIWDTFLYEGSKVLFRFATAFLKSSETEILQQADGLEMNRYLRKIGERMTNVQQICWFAFDWINPFSMRFLANKRQHHLQDIRVELAELDRIRHGIKMERANNPEVEYFSDDDIES